MAGGRGHGEALTQHALTLVHLRAVRGAAERAHQLLGRGAQNFELFPPETKK